MNTMNKIKVAVGSALGAVGSLLGVIAAKAQTVPTWDTTSTTTVVGDAASAFKTTFVYVLQVIGPYAIIVSLVVGVVWFFVRLARNH